MRAAAILRCPVFFMAGLYRGKNNYHVVFEPVADFSSTPAGVRNVAVRSAIERYAAVLDQYCRSDPYNWFNFLRLLVCAGRSPRRMKRRALDFSCWQALRGRDRSCERRRRDGLRTRTAMNDLDAVMGLLAMRRHGRVEFIEQQFLAVLDPPESNPRGIALRRAGSPGEAQLCSPAPKAWCSPAAY